MARVLQMSRSGYYVRLSRPPSHRDKENVLLDVEIKSVYETGKGRYGSVKITSELQ